MCVGTLKSFRFLVGGGWNNGSAGGLWCWNCWSVSTGTNINIGARLLSLIMGLDVYECWLAMSFALVGGMYWDALKCGLWYWALDQTSSYAYSNTGARLIIWELMCKSSTFTFFLVGGGCSEHFEAGLWFCRVHGSSTASWVSVGARLIILRYSLWDLMCFVLVFFSLHILLLLSAVDMIMVYRLACGIGIAGRTRVVLTLTSVLDLLYLKYTLRDLVCWLGLN